MAVYWMMVLISAEVMEIQILSSVMNPQMTASSVPPLERMWCSGCATTLIGPVLMSQQIFLWVMVSPILPFFCLVILSVTWSDLSRIGRGER